MARLVPWQLFILGCVLRHRFCDEDCLSGFVQINALSLIKGQIIFSFHIRAIDFIQINRIVFQRMQ